MLTRIVADRVYDYSHVVGGRQITRAFCRSRSDRMTMSSRS